MIRLLLLCMLMVPGVALAHETTRSYLTLSREGPQIAAHLRMTFRDIEVAVWLDADLDGRITWGEAKERLPQVTAYVVDRLDLTAGGKCPLKYRDAGTSNRAGLSYLDLELTALCPSADETLTVETRMFHDIDPDHRQLVQARFAGTATSVMLDAGQPSVRLDGDSEGWLASFVNYLRSGVEHLLGGADHMLFLIALMLPAVASGLAPRRAVQQVIFAISGFTLAHALTLTAATLQVLRPPTDIINLLVAVSIVLTSADNLRPFLPGPRAGVAAFFGIIHGFGFATALDALDLSGGELAVALLGFNIGLELAQIGLALVVMPALYMLHAGRGLLWGGSLIIGGVGVWWVYERIIAIS